MKKIRTGVLICTVTLTIGSRDITAYNAGPGDEVVPDIAYTDRESGDSSYGPFRTAADSGSRIPQKAYSPFEQLERRKAEQALQRRAEYKSDKVMVKLRPPKPQQTGGINVMQSQPAAPDLSGFAGVESLERVFPTAKAPSSGMKLMGVGLKNDSKEPDLTRWYRAG